MEVEPAAVPGVPVAPLRSEAAAFVPAAECSVLSDEWADGVVVFGPAAPPPADRVPGRDGFPDRPRRSLVARRSGSRSPHRDDGQLADPSAPPLVAGHFAAIKALVKRPDLDGKLVRLIEFDGAAGRWAALYAVASASASSRASYRASPPSSRRRRSCASRKRCSERNFEAALRGLSPRRVVVVVVVVVLHAHL